MTEDDIYALLAPLADGRVYPYVVPLGSDDLPAVAAPYIIFSIPTDVAGDVFWETGRIDAAHSGRRVGRN